MRADGELLLLVTGDLELVGQILGGLTHADVVAHLGELGMEGGIEAAHGDGEHVLDTDRDAALDVAGKDGLGELVHRVHGGAAEPIHHLAAGLLGDAGQQSDAAGHEHSLGVLGEGAAEHDILDGIARQIGLPVEQGDDDLCREIVGSDSNQISVLHPHGAANGIDDYAGSSHHDLLI